MFDKLSEELREARNKNGISLQQLALKTKIDIKFLKAIDDGNLSFLPDLYVKAFLKDYARNVGLDENIIIKKYQAMKEGKTYELPDNVHKGEHSKKNEEAQDKKEEPGEVEKKSVPEPVKEVKREPVRLQPSTTSFNTFKGIDYSDDKKDNSQRNIIIIGSIAVLLLLAGLIYYFFIRQSNEIIVAEKPYNEIIQENSDRYSDLNPKKDSVVSQAPVSDSLNLLITSNDTTWVKVLIDNTKSAEFMLFPGSRKQLAAGSVYKAVFGNSKSIQLLLNNKPLEFTNRGKRVTTVTIDTAGVHFDTTTQKKQGK